MPEERWMEGRTVVQDVVIKNISKKKKCKKARRQSGCLRRPYKLENEEKQKAKEKRKDTPIWEKFSISNNRALDKPHWLRYCHCTKLRIYPFESRVPENSKEK